MSDLNDPARLRDLLEQAAPASPDLDPTTRAAAVARRGRAARTRNRVLVPAAVAAVVAAAVAVPIALGDGGGPDQATPASPAPVQVEPCPTIPQDTADLANHGALNALDPAVIVAVRSCPALDAAGEALPQEPLVGEAAQAFVDDLLALPEYRMPSYCMFANIMAEPWVLQVQGDNGGVLSIGSPMRVCSSVEVNQRPVGVDQVVAAFQGNLAGVPDTLSCPTGPRLDVGAPTWNASFDPSTATAGVVCYREDTMGSSKYNGRTATLDESQLAAIRDDLAANLTTTPDDGTCIDTGPQRMVLLADADGDQAAWVDGRCSGVFTGPGGSWTPGQAAEQAYADALS